MTIHYPDLRPIREQYREAYRLLRAMDRVCSRRELESINDRLNEIGCVAVAQASETYRDTAPRPGTANEREG